MHILHVHITAQCSYLHFWMVDAILNAPKKLPELYEVLGCDRTSSISQITAEYRARVRSFHPDKTNDSYSKEQFVKLQAAYDTLSDSGTKKLYDSWLQTPLPITFDDFCKNSCLIKQSMHWVNPTQTPRINHNDAKPILNWAPEERSNSEAIRKFRNYEV